MKKIISYISLVSILSLSLSFCGKQDDIYKKYIKPGGYDYPAKPIKLSFIRGYKNLVIKWEKPMDPAVKTGKLFWDNYSQSLQVEYKDYPDGKVSVNVDELEDRAYTFHIVNYDNEGNKSLPAEITISPYGEGWLVSRSERRVLSAKMKEDSAVVMMSKATDEMISTKFRYKNEKNEWVECEKQLKPGENRIAFYKPLKGKRFEYSSSFCPKEGKDIVWRSWMKSFDGISYELNALRWTVVATNGQVFAENTPEKIFDGKNLSGFRYHSSKSESLSKVFPKILTVDTKTAAGEEYAFTSFRFCESTESSGLRYIKNFFIYVGNNMYNPDDENFSDSFGIPFINSVLSTASAEQEVSASQGGRGRYLALVFTNSWSKDGYIDLWELVPYGYIPSQAD